MGFVYLSWLNMHAEIHVLEHAELISSSIDCLVISTASDVPTSKNLN